MADETTPEVTPAPTPEPTPEPTPASAPAEVPAPDIAADADIVKKDAEKDTRSTITRLWDESISDIEKGLDWFKAEIAKL